MRLSLFLYVLIAACLLGAAPASASSGQFTLFEAPRELESSDASLRAQTFDELDALGVKWVRVVLYWRNVAPSPDASDAPSFDETDPSAYPGWDRYDRLISEARARGMKLLVTISGPVPRWATAGGRDHVTKPSPSRFQRFATAVGRRYGDQVDLWSIWNEPNHPSFLAPQYTSRHRAYSPGLYRKLFFAGERGLRASGNGSDPLLMGETAPRGTSKVVAPLTFLRGALCLSSRYRKRRGCASMPTDGFAHHPYTTASGPGFRPSDRDDVTIGVLSRLTSALDRAGRARAVPRGLPVYVTEFGIQSEPDPYIGVSFERQAEYRSISERIAYRNRRVRSFAQYLMRDDDPRPGGSAAQRFSGFESGLRLAGGDAKLSYEGFRLPLVAERRGSRDSLWGLVRPGSGSSRVTIEVRRRGSSSWRRLKSDTTNSRGYWSTSTAYRRGTRYRVVWADHTGPPTRAY